MGCPFAWAGLTTPHYTDVAIGLTGLVNLVSTVSRPPRIHRRHDSLVSPVGSLACARQEGSMKRFLVAAAMLAAAVAYDLGPGRLAAALQREDTRRMGQLNGTAPFTVVDGAIVGTTVVESPNSFLGTKEEFGDFILEYEAKLDAPMNSGVQIRGLSTPVDPERPRARLSDRNRSERPGVDRRPVRRGAPGLAAPGLRAGGRAQGLQDGRVEHGSASRPSAPPSARGSTACRSPTSSTT